MVAAARKGDVVLIATRSRLPILLLLCCMLSAMRWIVSLATQPWVPDYSVFWVSATFGVSHPELLYNDFVITAQQASLVNIEHGLRPWVYPPSALTPLLLFAGPSFMWSYAIFAAVGFGSYVYVVSRMAGSRDAVIVVLLSVLADSLLLALINGQLSLLLASLIIGGMLLLDRRPIAGAFLWGVAASIKPSLMIFAPLALIAIRNPKALLAFLATGGLMIALSLPLGFERWLEWLSATARFMDTVGTLGIGNRNITPFGIVQNSGFFSWGATIVELMFGLLGTLAVWLTFRQSSDPAKRLVALVGSAILAAPYMMNYDLALLSPAAALFVCRFARGEAPLLPALFGGLLLITYGAVTPATTILFITAVLIPWPSSKLGQQTIVTAQ